MLPVSKTVGRDIRGAIRLGCLTEREKFRLDCNFKWNVYDVPASYLVCYRQHLCILHVIMETLRL